MLQFLFANLLMVSLGTILFLLARTLPRVEDAAEERKPSLIERWVTSELPHRADRAVNYWLGKLFRKLKVFLLRLDNHLTARLKKINTTEAVGITGEVKQKIDFGGMAEEVRTSDYIGPDRRAADRRRRRIDDKV